MQAPIPTGLADLPERRCATCSPSTNRNPLAVHGAAALGPEINDPAARRRTRTDGPQQHTGMSTTAHDLVVGEVHAVLNDRETGR